MPTSKKCQSTDGYDNKSNQNFETDLVHLHFEKSVVIPIQKPCEPKNKEDSVISNFAIYFETWL